MRLEVRMIKYFDLKVGPMRAVKELFCYNFCGPTLGVTIC